MAGQSAVGEVDAPGRMVGIKRLPGLEFLRLAVLKNESLVGDDQAAACNLLFARQRLAVVEC
jgi:hypothetical protein